MDAVQKQVILRCKSSITWFLENFGRVKHPAAGILPFKLFSYQKMALKAFKNNRFNIFKKCRQCGISKISGAFALWYGMFNANKTILIVSRRDEDAKGFLKENIAFPFDNLPVWMQELWAPRVGSTGRKGWNEHTISFTNGTVIKSMTSHPDVLRSNASSLNIIDEAAFINDMDVMWAAGYSTMTHGGSTIVISTTNGTGNWYWSTWTDAETGANNFNPICVNWWDMDWSIEYNDALTNNKVRIAPRDGLRECVGKIEIDRYGPYWSPWLEEQWCGLQEKGEGWKFNQEVLAMFVGSGNTVLDKSVLTTIATTIKAPEKITNTVTYVQPVTRESEELDFEVTDQDAGLWVWQKPIIGKPAKIRNNQIIEHGMQPHSYVIGVDFSTGKSKDYHALEVVDINTMEQVAEMMVRCLPMKFLKYLDFIGRWYNNALLVIERNNGGDNLIDTMRHTFQYPKIWRKKDINDRPNMSGGQRALKIDQYGFFTSIASKPTLNRLLLDYLRDNADEGYKVYSRRLLKQLNTYVRKRDKSGRDTGQTEAEEGANNYDDLVIAFALALVGVSDFFGSNDGPGAPVLAVSDFTSMSGPLVLDDSEMVRYHQALIDKTNNPYIPFISTPDDTHELSIQRQLDNFTYQMGAIPMTQSGPVITPPKYFKR